MSQPQIIEATGGDLSRHFGDAISFGVVIATIAEWLPAIAALLTIVWTAIRIYETRTVQRLTGRGGDRA